MKTLITLILIAFFISPSFANDCIRDLDEYVDEVSANGAINKVKVANHTLIIPKDSCGAKGCEVFIFSQVYPGCVKETLNTKGFYINRSLNSLSVRIKFNNFNRLYRYNYSRMRFE